MKVIVLQIQTANGAIIAAPIPEGAKDEARSLHIILLFIMTPNKHDEGGRKKKCKYVCS